MRTALALCLLLYPAIAQASAAFIVVKSARLTDNGDNDGFADPNETVSLYLTLRNVSDTPLTGIAVALETPDATVDCVLTPVVSFGSLAARETREAALPLTFRVANVTRTDPSADLTATFGVRIWGDAFDQLSVPQQVTLDLDLNVSGGFIPTTFTEGFESGGFGAFTTMTLDVGKASVSGSNGLRCQYQNPNVLPCQSCGNPYCYVGFPNASDNAFDWHVHALSSPDGGRAYLGNNSLHWGMHPGAFSADTTRLKQLDALRTALPVNLGWNGVTSELSFKHQAALVNCDHVNCTPPNVVDRGVVQAQLADSSGNGVGAWRKLYPYENLYDGQAVDNYSNCTFDPTDDGNDENDFFGNDPETRHGPSSTCYPEFAFASEGDVAGCCDIPPTGHHTDGPLLSGVRGPGHWVQSKFSLDRWRGRRLRLRFLVTSIEVATAVSMEQALAWNPTLADDGWYIDDIQVTNTLTSAATVAVDPADRSGLPACGPACSFVTAALTATPASTSAPGEPVTLDASASFADTCGGPLLYRFWLDEDQDGATAASEDTLLRDWTDDPVLSVSPAYTSGYLVETRCSSLPTCAGHATALVDVPCPASPTAFPEVMRANGNSMGWDSLFRVDAVQGNLSALRAGNGQFQGSVLACLVDDVRTNVVVLGGDPSPGSGFYYLVRAGGLVPDCARTWSTGASRELPGAGGDRDADLALDPNNCP